MKKIAVCSTIMGAYDTKLFNPHYDDSKYEFILFTNIKRLKSNTWNIKYVDCEIPGNIAKSAYYFKWNLHNILDPEQYERVVWIDSSIRMLNMVTFDKFIDEFIESDDALWIEKHPSNNTVQNELSLNVRLNKDDKSKMINQVQKYYNEGYKDKDDSCVETGFSLRKLDDDSLNLMCDTLWDEMKGDMSTKRDQLIYDYALWKTKFTNYTLFSFQKKCELLQFQDHPNRSSHKEKVLVVGPYYGEEYYEPQWVEYVTDYIKSIPVDSIVVGCRPGREYLYDSLSPDKIITKNVDGIRYRNLLNGKVPSFNITSKDKDIIQLNPSTKIFNRFKHLDGSIHFKIEIVGWKCEKYIERCLDSLYNQKHRNWQAQIVLDPNSDGDKTYELAKRYKFNNIVNVVMNDERMGSLYNHRQCVALMAPKPEDVIVTLDSDDWFAHEYALTTIENAYLEKRNTLVTHGSWIDYPNPGSLQPNNSVAYTREELKLVRQSFFKGSHVRTMKAKIWNAIEEDDLKGSDGKYFETAGDVALMIPALEMAGFDRVTFINDILYIYNRETAFNDDKCRLSQGQNHMQVVKKLPYQLYKNIVMV